MGGLKSVIWIDVLQLFVYLSGGIFVISWILGSDLPVETGLLQNSGKLTVIQLPTSISDLFYVPYNLIGAVIGGIFLTLASHGTDHLIVQRLLACGSLKNARKALVSSALFVMLQFGLFLSVGLALYAFYNGASIAALGINNGDEIFLKFVTEQIPSGVTGLIIAGLFAAAMSTLSSSLAALSSTTLFDIFPKLALRPDAMRISRYLMVGWTLVFFLFAVSFTSTENPIIELGLGIAGFTYGGLLGAFFCGSVHYLFSHSCLCRTNILYFRYDIDYISNRYRMALVHFLGNIHILYGSRTGQPAKSNSWQDLTNPVIRYIHYD